MSFSFKDRQTSFTSLASDPPDLLIIGAGVVGCSIAAHAARFGLKVVVLEKEDIGAGASGNSTGLAHAGLRYLAQGRLGYVFREGRERQRLQELAPQWVSPFNFILPAYKNDPYKFWMVRLGTWLYDLLGWIDAVLAKRSLVKRHKTLSAEEVKAKVPGIRADGLEGGIEYYVDARLQDNRFTLGYAQQAAQLGARVLTHCEVLSITATDELPPTLVARDLLTGRTFDLRVPLVINATGAWIDLLREKIEMKNSLLQKSKGVHLIVDSISSSPLIMSSAVKGKVFFVIPIDHERSLVGTTDTAVAESPDEVKAESHDVMELLQQLFFFFPYLKQGRNLLEAIESYKQVHVRDVYWAVRPLFSAHATSSLEISREHQLVKDLPRFWSIPGVKLTAGRAVGLEVASDAWRFLRNKTPLPTVSWDSLPGGELWDFDRFVRDAQKNFKLGPESEKIIRYLIGMYGTKYVDVLQWSQREPQFSQPFLKGEPWLLAQAAYAVQEEMTLTLNDFLWRRTKWAHYRDLPANIVLSVAKTLGRYLEWADDEVKKQIAEFEREQKKHRLG